MAKRSVDDAFICDEPLPPNVKNVLPVCDGFSCADLRRIVNDAKVHAAYDKHDQHRSKRSSAGADKHGEDGETKDDTNNE